LLGILTPLFLVYGFLYITGKDIEQLISDAGANLFGETTRYNYPAIEMTALIVMGAVLLVSLVKLLPSLGIKKIKQRKTFILLIWTLIITGLVYSFSRSASAELIWIAGIPASFITSHYFVYAKKKLIPGILFLSMFVVTALAQILYLI
jgi:hypothetical protein